MSALARSARIGRRAGRAGLGLPGLPAAGRVARGGRPHRPAGVVRRPAVLGPARARASATRRRGCSSSAWRRPPTAPTGPAGCSPATAAATGSTPRCTGPGSPRSRGAGTPATARSCTAPGSSRPCAARRRPTSRRRRSATPAATGWTATSSWPPRPCGCCWPSGRSAGTPRSPPSAGSVALHERPKPRFGHGARAELAVPERLQAQRCCPDLDAARQLPRQPAEHLHRQADRADAGRRPGPGPGAAGAERL